MENRHFTAIVIGENPDETMKRYDSTLKVEPYVVYYANQAAKYKNDYEQVYEALANDQTSPDYIRESYKESLDTIKNQTVDEFYEELTSDFEIDENTGDAICDVNPNGKYNTCRLGKNLSMPLIDLSGNEVFQARKKDIDWSKIHLANQDVYRVAWELVMEGRTPETDDEKTIYDNMKNRTEYFKFFGTKENYVMNSTAFWGYAFVDGEHWFELEDNMSQIEWVKDFYDNFIKNLPENTLISVYECTRN